MNWLHPLKEKLRARETPGERDATIRDALVLLANELAAVCNQVAPSAPEPEITGATGPLLLKWATADRLLMS